MSEPGFSPVPSSDAAHALATLVAAFINDPVERWLYPQAHQYLGHFPTFLEAFGGRAFGEQTVWGLSDFSAVALWLPPGIEPDGEAIAAVLTRSVASHQHADMFAVLAQMDAAHPRYPHWYLPWFGVDSVAQGQGLGHRLMASCLEITDASHVPTYLETPNPRNISFYERFGFQVTGRAVAGTCPPVTFMKRPAR